MSEELHLKGTKGGREETRVGRISLGGGSKDGPKDIKQVRSRKIGSGQKRRTRNRSRERAAHFI